MTVSGTFTTAQQVSGIFFLRATETMRLDLTITGSATVVLQTSEYQPTAAWRTEATHTATVADSDFKNTTGRDLYLRLLCTVVSGSAAYSLDDVAGDQILLERYDAAGNLCFRVTDEGIVVGMGNVNVRAHGATGDGTTDDTEAIQAANDACAGTGVLVIPPDTYYINGTVVLNTHVSAVGATFSVGASGSITVGTTSSGQVKSRLQLMLPEISSSRDRATVWTEGTQSGLTISNLINADVRIPYVVGFWSGVKVVGVGTGSVHNTIAIGRLYNNKRNLVLDNGSGWANQNQFVGGQLTFDSAIGTAVADTRHLVCDDNGSYGPPNGNTFVGTSFEGNVPEYEVYCTGAENVWLNCRWEGATPKVYFTSAEATRNLILGGYDAEDIVMTQASSASRNTIITATRSIKTIGSTTDPERIQNLTDSSPTSQIFPSSVDIGAIGALTTWTQQFGADRYEMKATGDSAARIRLTPATGRVYFGNGTITITAGPYFEFERFGSASDYVALAVGALAFNSAAGSPTCGSAVLVGGTVTVSTTQVHTNSIVLLTRKTAGGTLGNLTYTISSETSFTINSTDGADTSTVDWLIIGKT